MNMETFVELAHVVSGHEEDIDDIIKGRPIENKDSDLIHRMIDCMSKIAGRSDGELKTDADRLFNKLSAVLTARKQSKSDDAKRKSPEGNQSESRLDMLLGRLRDADPV